MRHAHAILHHRLPWFPQQDIETLMAAIRDIGYRQPLLLNQPQILIESVQRIDRFVAGFHPSKIEVRVSAYLPQPKKLAKKSR